MQRYHIVETNDLNRGPWKVTTTGYEYALLDPQGREILTYHWNPVDAGPPYPHMHVSGRLTPLDIGKGLPPIPLGELHIPTDRVALEAVIRLLLEEFEVPPRKPEHEWRRILDEGEAAFRAWRTRSG